MQTKEIATITQMTTPLEAATRAHNLAYLGYVTVLLLAAFFTWYTWHTGNNVQDIARRDADARIASAGVAADQARVGAATANENAARANESAALANERSKGLESTNLALRKQVATLETNAAEAAKEVAALQKSAADAGTVQHRVEIELSKQKERAAVAERSLLELRERIRPRMLNPLQVTEFVRILANQPGTTVNFGYTVGGGDESFNFARQLLPLFKEAGWNVKNENSPANHLEISVTGIGILCRGSAGPDPMHAPSGYIKLTPTLTTLRQAFNAVGLNVQFINWQMGEDDTVEVVVGSKPQS